MGLSRSLALAGGAAAVLAGLLAAPAAAQQPSPPLVEEVAQQPSRNQPPAAAPPRGVETGPEAAFLDQRAPKPRVEAKRKPKVKGVPRFTRTLTATRGAWKGGKVRVKYRWLRNGEPIRGKAAAKRRYRLGHADVGNRIRVQVTAFRKGHAKGRQRSTSVKVKHRIGVRRVVTYRVETRGPITASLKVFRRQAKETFADPRGWRNAGVEFREVKSGGQFSLVLSAASHVRGFSSMCSSYYSCRVGRYVIINQDRWKHATPSWNAAQGSLRGYRHMVVNHETGHWLGHGHRGCPGKGPAPVMMQQSKGLHGCTHNPWPLPSELWTR